MNISWVAAPLVGAAIGYITNDLAIRMLFHPHKAIYIGRFRLPFTPGLIPKEKSRVAGSLGRMIAGQLLNEEVLEKVLLSDEMTDKIERCFDLFVERHRNSKLTIYELAEKYLGDKKAEEISMGISSKAVQFIKKTVKEQDLGELAAGQAVEYMKHKANGFMKNFIPMLESGIKPHIKTAINDIIDDNIDSLSESVVENKMDEIKNIKINELADEHEDKIDKLKSLMMDFYRSVIKYKLSDIVNSVNISKIVEDRVNDFSIEELEKLIFGIMKRELNMIVYLGALLGMIMGFVNLLF